MNKNLSSDCTAIRSTRPLVLNVTNYVAMQMTANALLAIGASPIMSSFAEEMEELMRSAASLCINIGCLDRDQAEAMSIAARTANATAKPWVLDPAGAGASTIRTETCLELIRSCHPTIIRGNASEIRALHDALYANATERHDHSGVDSTARTEEVRTEAEELARMTGAVVSVSGEWDLITDGWRSVRTEGGSAMMPRVTAMGCTASALAAAFAAVEQDAMAAATHAAELMKRAGTIEEAEGPGSFAERFIDNLYKVSTTDSPSI